MDKFVRHLITEWRRLELPFEGGTIVAAVSGGADSVSLLLGLCDLRERKKLKLGIIAAHFDHGLRGEHSDADAEFVRKLSSDLGVEFIVGKMRAAKRGNLEQHARAERYAFLRETAAARDAFAVCTGHTMNDQAETFLINLLRGSGPGGLSAMPPVRPIDAKKPEIMLVRPLLRWANRSDTEGFCRLSGVRYRLDAMNADPAFTRVRVRTELLPLMQQFNPKIIETLAHTAGLMAADVPDIDRVAEVPDALAVSDLRNLPQSELYLVIRRWLDHKRGKLRSLGLKHIEAIGNLVHSRKSGSTVELPGHSRVVKHSGELRFENILVDK